MNGLQLSHHFWRQMLSQSRLKPFFASRTFSGSGTMRIGDKKDVEEEPQDAVTDDFANPSYPTYRERQGESLEVQKARLLYQSRKRGTLENGLLLSTFAACFLSSMTPNQLAMYDQLINKPSNDWDIYYWVVGSKPVPKEFDNEMFALLKQHAKNEGKEMRVTMPDLLKH